MLWWRGAEQGCGRPPADARPQLEWSGTVRGDEPLPLCVRAAGEGPLRLTATLRALQPDGTWRVRVIVSEPAAAGEPFISSSIFLALITAVLGFAFGVAANLIQLRGQQRGEREKRSQELDLKRLAVDEKVFDSVTAEVQKNVDVLRAVIAGNPPPGVVQLTLAGMQAVLADPETAAFLNDGDGRPYQQRMRRVYNHMRDFNRAVRDPNNQVPLAQLAARARDGIEAELQV